jgi:DNA-binding transcriptional MerR regulator
MTLTNDRTDPQYQPAASHGVYGISVAAELSGIPVQSLRLYESHGLLTPIRSDGGTRRYSADDLARLRRISGLVAAGVNLAGIGRILELEDHNAALLAENRARTEKSTGNTKPR